MEKMGYELRLEKVSKTSGGEMKTKKGKINGKAGEVSTVYLVLPRY